MCPSPICNPVVAKDPVADWREVMKQAFRDPLQLCHELELPESWMRRVQITPAFPLFAPQPFVARVEKGNPYDPLLRQILPLRDEDEPVDGFTSDPVHDLEYRSAPGVIQKYRGRALVVATGACAVHCRYCFRRHFPYEESPVSTAEWQTVIDQLAADPALEEVILSGGDPLTLVDNRLEPLVQQIGGLPTLRRLRIHTRLPVMIPQRITPRLLDCLDELDAAVIVVVHINHPREIDDHVSDALAKLNGRRLMLLNQAVLLRGINDRLETLVELSRELVDRGVLPYYLHQLDRVAGAAHFEVPVAKGRQLVEGMLGELPGFAVPRYVQDVPGRSAKHSLLS